MTRTTPPPEEEVALVGGGPGPGLEVNDRVINLLVWFKQIRYAAKCFEYIVKARPNFGDAGESCRRALLVLKLTCAQREEFSDLFRIINTSLAEKVEICVCQLHPPNDRHFCLSLTC